MNEYRKEHERQVKAYQKSLILQVKDFVMENIEGSTAEVTEDQYGTQVSFDYKNEDGQVRNGTIRVCKSSTSSKEFVEIKIDAPTWRNYCGNCSMRKALPRTKLKLVKKDAERLAEIMDEADSRYKSFALYRAQQEEQATFATETKKQLDELGFDKHGLEYMGVNKRDRVYTRILDKAVKMEVTTSDIALLDKLRKVMVEHHA